MCPCVIKISKLDTDWHFSPPPPLFFTCGQNNLLWCYCIDLALIKDIAHLVFYGFIYIGINYPSMIFVCVCICLPLCLSFSLFLLPVCMSVSLPVCLLELPPRLISLFEDTRVATGLTVCLNQSGGQCFHNGNIDHKLKK